MDNLIDLALSQANLAKGLSEDQQNKIADEVIQAYQRDDRSRQKYIKQNEEWVKLAMQVMENKTFPWEKASNVKYPLLTVAALQFASRAYPALLSSQDIVKVKVFGSDPDGSLAAKGDNLSKHMSYQVLHEMVGWEEDLDRLCYVLPIYGTAFKKVYYDSAKGQNCSELVLPKDLVINYWASNLEGARKTHKLYVTPNDIVADIAAEYFLDQKEATMEASITNSRDQEPSPTAMSGVTTEADLYTPRLLLEQHTLLDLDKDGYKEPYIVTVDFESGKLLRIGARFRKDDVKTKGKKILSITPCEYFVKYQFLPNPDGGFYGCGFGLLLGGVNEALNTLINQLVDAGTLSNLQAGFISKGIRIKQGPMPIKPGEWVTVNNYGDDLRKGIYPLPAKEPSGVLFNLLGILAQTGREIASVSEVNTGKFPGQNTPASTTSAVIEEGMKVFSSIHKRIHASVGKELNLIYKCNQVYLPETVDFTLPVAGTEQSKNYSAGVDQYNSLPVQGQQQSGGPFAKVVLGSDPSMINDAQKALKTQGLLELHATLGTLNPMAVTKKALEQQGQENIAELMQPPPPPPPNPEIELKKAEIAETQRHNQAQEQLDYMSFQSESMKRESEAYLNYAKAQALGNSAQIEQAKAEAERTKTREESFRRNMEMMLTAKEGIQKQVMSAQEHQQELTQNDQLHQQALTHAERMARVKEEVASASQTGGTN